MEQVRIGVVGCGVIGRYHLDNISKNDKIKLIGVCDIDEKQAKKIAKDNDCKAFSDYKELVLSDNIDVVIVATPHYQHPEISIWAFEHGVHVLCEKPIAVQVNEARSINDVHKKHPELKFGIVFQMRRDPLWRQVKKLIETGETGKIFRVSWIVTTWLRTQSYYDSGGWRGTWKGEGGGVLMNQCPHQLDLLQWFFGMPEEITSVCNFGKYHDVEIEDDVTAIFKYSDGKTLTFVASTGEFPGTNRLEISCEHGRIVVENEKIKFDRTVNPVSEFVKDKSSSGVPEVWDVNIPISEKEELPIHAAILENFVQAVLGKEELSAPGTEGLNSLTLANAMVYAGVQGKPVKLPLDGDEYEKFLNDMIAKSKG